MIKKELKFANLNFIIQFRHFFGLACCNFRVLWAVSGVYSFCCCEFECFRNVVSMCDLVHAVETTCIFHLC